MSRTPMRRGQYNRKVTVYGLPTDEDDWGEKGGVRPVFGRPWANFGKPSGKAVIAAGIAVSEISVSVRVPFRRGYQGGMWVVIGDVRYDIKVPLYDEEFREHVDLLCASGVAHV